MIALSAEAKLIVLSSVVDRLESLAAAREAADGGDRELYLPARDLVRELRTLIQAKPQTGQTAATEAMDQLGLWAEVYRGRVPPGELTAWLLTEAVQQMRELGVTRSYWESLCRNTWEAVERAETELDAPELQG